MVSFEDFCIFITITGKIYAMGKNEYGMLGLGAHKKNTNKMAKQIHLPNNEIIKEVKIGKG